MYDVFYLFPPRFFDNFLFVCLSEIDIIFYPKDKFLLAKKRMYSFNTYFSFNRTFLEINKVDLGLYAIHVIAGVLKLFFRTLPSPLITESLYDEFLRACGKDITP